MKLLTVKAEDGDYDSWKLAAGEAGMDLSAWIRELANAARDGKNMRGSAPDGVAERSIAASERTADSRKPRSRNTELAEAIAGRTHHAVGCECFDCIQVGRFFKSQRKEE